MLDTASGFENSRHPCRLIDDSTQLTVLPAAVPELLSALSDEGLDFEGLAKVISQFPSIAARLLFLANSAWAAPVKEITTLEKACIKLGLSLVRSVSISLAIAAPFDPARCRSFRSDKFWGSALLVGDATGWLAAASPLFDKSEVGASQTAALLHNLGLLWLADNLSEPADRAFRAVEVDPHLSLSASLRSYCGADHAEVGGCLARAWSFPEVIEVAMAQHLAVGYQGNYWPAAAATGLAASMVHALDYDDAMDVVDPRCQRLRLSKTRCEEIFQRLRSRHQRVHEMVKLLFC